MAILKLRAATDTLKEVAGLYLLLLLVAALFFSAFEERSFLESLYWAATTATSTGYGDISANLDALMARRFAPTDWAPGEIERLRADGNI